MSFLSGLSGLFSRRRDRVTVGTARLGIPEAGPILDYDGTPFADQRRSPGPDVRVRGLYALKGDWVVCEDPRVGR